MGNIFKLLLSLPLLLLLWESFANIYYWYFDFSFALQVSLLLLWSVIIWWVIKTKEMPLPIVASAFVVVYLSFVVGSIDLSLRTYLENALWAGAYTYLLRSYYMKWAKDNALAGGDKQ